MVTEMIEQDLTAWAWATALVIVSPNGNGLQFRALDQAQCNTHIVKPLLQFAVHITPPLGNAGS